MTGTLRTALLLAVPFLAACKSGLPSSQGSHWALESVPLRMTQHFTGYRSDLHGSFVDYQYRKKKDISLTLRRHFLNNSPDSPFEADDPSQTNPRPAHSLSPDPLYYMGAESLFIGLATLGISGVFVPVPIDSPAATAVDLGDEGENEFLAGFTGGRDALRPPRNSDFKVKNR